MKDGNLKLTEQQEEVGTCFHGRKKKGLISHISMLSRGEDMLLNSFRKTQTRHKRSSSGKSFVPLKAASFLARTSNRVFLSKQSLIQELLSLHANSSIKNDKKALSVLPKCLDMNAGEPCHSDQSVDDVANSNLDVMWVMEQETPPEETANRRIPGDEDGEEDSDKKTTPSPGILKELRPADWVFKGFMPFMFFGPFKENFEANGVLIIFNTKDSQPEEKKEHSQNLLQERKQPPREQSPETLTQAGEKPSRKWKRIANSKSGMKRSSAIRCSPQ